MDDVAFTALEHQDRIAAILEEAAGKEEVKPGWSPWNPLCSKCGRLDRGRVLDFDRRGNTVRSQLRSLRGDGKLAAGRRRRQADLARRLAGPLEGAGRLGRAVRQGPRQPGRQLRHGERIAREVFGVEPPHPIVYEWIALKGQGDMSSSKGNVLAADELLHVAPPEVLRYVVLRSRPQRSIQFDPGMPFLRLVDEVDDASAARVGQPGARASRAAGFTPVGVPFHHLVLVAQIARFDLDRTLGLLERGGYGPLDRAAVAERMAMARYGLIRFAPEEGAGRGARRSCRPRSPGSTPRSACFGGWRRRCRSMAAVDAIEEAFRELAGRPAGGPGAKRGFEAVYAALIGGPRPARRLVHRDPRPRQGRRPVPPRGVPVMSVGAGLRAGPTDPCRPDRSVPRRPFCANLPGMAQPFELVSDFRPTGDQPQAIDALSRGVAAGVRDQVLLGVTGSGKTFTIAHVVAGRGRPDPRPGAQQDARGAALPGVPDALPAQRGRVLRLVLRLLPAGGVRSAVGHVHREGVDDQRGDRPDAALGDPGALRAARRAHRGQRVVHLRPGLARRPTTG